jgi:hypothetical protein
MLRTALGRWPSVWQMTNSMTGDLSAHASGQCSLRTDRRSRAGIDALRRGGGFDTLFVRARRKVVQGLLGDSTRSRELAARLALIAGFGLAPR